METRNERRNSAGAESAPPATDAGAGGEAGKRYACASCPYATDRRDLFTRHENIHRDEKPFHCYLCQKQFNRADHVKKHFLRMHRDQPYDLNRIRRAAPKPQPPPQPQPPPPAPAPTPALHYYSKPPAEPPPAPPVVEFRAPAPAPPQPPAPPPPPQIKLERAPLAKAEPAPPHPAHPAHPSHPAHPAHQAHQPHHKQQPPPQQQQPAPQPAPQPQPTAATSSSSPVRRKVVYFTGASVTADLGI